MKRHPVSLMFKRFNVICDSILLHYTEHFKALCHVVLFSDC